MIIEMALGAVMIVATTVIQGGFTFGGIAMLRTYLAQVRVKSNMQATLVLAAFVLWLFLSTILQVTAWAVLYVLIDALPSFEEALYFSTVTFTTLGYGDITLGPSWRLLSSFEAANGLLMFGWSTALVFAAVQWMYGHAIEHKRHR